jgi:hypothetical protein
MPDVNIKPPQLPAAEEADLEQYRGVSPAAIAALALGLLSPAALFSIVAWALPIAGVATAWWALRRIRDEAPALLGRKAALVGLTLSLVMLAAGPAAYYCYRSSLYREAKQFGKLFFALLSDDRPDCAHQLTLAPEHRSPSDEPMSETYPLRSDARRQLQEFANRNEIRALLALGKAAEARYFYTESIGSENGKDYVDAVYAITYRPEGEPVSFFLNMRLSRMRSGEHGRSFWMVNRIRPGGQPVALGGSPEQFR